ncbi:Midnolin, partial [Aptenodytes forsteri]
SRLSSGKLQDLGVVEGSKLTLVPTVEAGLMVNGLFLLLPPSHSSPSIIKAPGEDVLAALRLPRPPPPRPCWAGHGSRFNISLLSQGLCRNSGSDIAGSGFARIPVVPACQQSPAPSPAPAAPAPPMYCNAPHPAPVTAGMFRSHGASTQTHAWVPCPEADPASLPPAQVDCSTRSSSSPGSSPAPTARSRKPGAVIESFVNHAPGVFSGTFSGTLHPNCQDSSGRPRRDIGTILQILNDLLSATRHYQGMPQSLTQLRCQTQFSSSSSSPPASPDLATKTTSEPLPAAAASPPLHPVVQCQSQIRMCKPSGKPSCLHASRGRGPLPAPRARAPYHWLPNRKSSRTNSNSSVSSEGSLDLDFEDSVWKPEVKADMKSEFVVA